jgi:hypothetical protein
MKRMGHNSMHEENVKYNHILAGRHEIKMPHLGD